MLRINPGPNVEKFARAMDSSVNDVLAWANQQLNDPMEFYSKEYPTPEDRLKAIKAYMLWVIEYDLHDKAKGINERIKNELAGNA